MMKQESLFANSGQNEPLANRVRPQKLDQFVGQEQLLGPGKILREIINNCLLYTSDAADE